MMRTPVYVVLKDTGLKDADGVSMVLLLDVKLTRGAADQVAAFHNNAFVEKRYADKEYNQQ